MPEISQLPNGGALQGTDIVPATRSGITYRTTPSNFLTLNLSNATGYTDGQLLIGNTLTGSLSKATLIAGSGMTITNGNGTITLSAPDTGTVTVVSGTTNRISVINGTTTPVIDIDAAYVGQASIITLGTVTTGTWGATTVAINKGGTGNTTYTDGQLLIGNTSGNTLTKATLTAGSGISITNGNGSITIDNTGPGTGTVTNVTGTANRISVINNTTTPVVDIDAAYVGQASITTLGTIGTGAWNGTTIAANHGGTGVANNSASTITISGNFASTFTITNTTNVTFPTSGTLTTLATVISTVNAYTAQQNFAEATLTSTANSVAWNLSTAQTAVHTLTENTTLANPSNMIAGGTYIIRVVQAAVAKTLAFGAAYKWAGGTAPIVSTGNGQVDIYTFYSNGTQMLGTFAQNIS